MISSIVRASTVTLCLIALAGGVSILSAQTNYYTTNGIEYSVVGSLPGDQVFPDVAVNTNGGLMVWQDNITDGSGWGISAQRVDSTLSGTGGSFRINAQGTNDQENAHVALLKNGGAVVVWQGGKQSYQHIFARFLTPTNTFLTTTDLAVSTVGSYQIKPAVTVLNNSNVVVVWSSYNQVSTNSMMDVYAKILSPAGAPVRSEFLVNQFTSYNQRTPVVSALKGGGFVVAWVSEQQRLLPGSDSVNYINSNVSTTPSVDIYARLYQNNGTPVANEFMVNADANPCANPSVAAADDGTFLVAWSGRDVSSLTNGWDVYARPFSGTGIGGAVVRLNTYLYGAQYAPHVSAISRNYLAVWTSLGQDGSREGVYGQSIFSDGTLVGNEFRVNDTTVSQQLQPVVTSDGATQFIAVWTSYLSLANGFDLVAQRYIDVSSVLQAMSAPFVSAPFTLSNGKYQPQLLVSWPTLPGISVSSFEVYVDGAAQPAATITTNQWVMTAASGLTNGTTHSFQVDYVRSDTKRSPLSPAASGTTWSGLNWGGIPYEWMRTYFGDDASKWPSAGSDADGDGISNLQEFLAGTVPTNAASVLRVQLNKTAQGLYVQWPTVPGLTYQVQMSTNLGSWSSLGSPRYAAGTTDSIYVGGNTAGYYRITLLRQ